MNRRLVIAGVASAALVGAVVPAFAQSGAQSGPPALPVTVTTDTHDGVSVGTAVGNQPLVGARVSPDGEVCAGVSLQLPVCVGGGIGTIIDPPGTTQQELPLPKVVARHDENGTAVGVDNVGVRIENDGRICPVVSTQYWPCIGGDN